MKNLYKYLLCFISLLSIYCYSAFAREYVPTVREDRVWEYFGRSAYEPVSALHYMRFDDTLTVNDKEYTRFVLFRTKSYGIVSNQESPILFNDEQRNETMYYLREADGRVLILTYDNQTVSNPDVIHDASLAGEFPIYDWSSSQDDDWTYPALSGYFSDNALFHFTVNSLAPIVIDNRECSVMYLSGEMAYYGDKIQFIEGIGVTFNGSIGYVNLTGMPGMSDSSRFPELGSRLNRVFRDTGELVYQDESAFIPSGIEDVTDDVSTAGDGRIYDMMGREVKAMQPGGVYIRNGRKFIGK